MARRSTRARFALGAALLAVAASGCGGDGDAPAERPAQPPDRRADLEHIHGLGADPRSGELLVATHHGMFHAAEGETRLQPLGETRQDVMGFSVVGPDRAIGSGHPDPAQDLPPHLGLIESRDGGRTWRNVSLLGEADFHVLRSAGRRIYGVDSRTGRLFASDDAGRSWTRHRPPAATFDLAIDPRDDRHVVVSTERGLFASRDAGRTWRRFRDDLAGLLAWPSAGTFVLVDGRGAVSRSGDGGRSFEAVGSIGGPPVAFAAAEDDLYAALGDGTVLRSTDSGATWRVRAKP